jgi:hypothetical protein
VPASRTRGRAERIAILDRNLRPFAATVGAASIFPVGRIGAYPRLLTQPQASRFGQTREAVGPRLRWGIPPATVTRVIRRALRHRDRPARRVRGDHPAGLTSTLRPVSSFRPRSGSVSWRGSYPALARPSRPKTGSDTVRGQGRSNSRRTVRSPLSSRRCRTTRCSSTTTHGGRWSNVGDAFRHPGVVWAVRIRELEAT